MQRILLGALALVAVIIALGFVLPDKVHVERSATIDAPRDKVFALVSDFHNWNAWSPWADIDPATTYEITGSGLGQTMRWSSKNPKVGNGSQEIVAFEPDSLVKTKLRFDQGGGEATMTLAEEGGATKVVWTLDTRMREGAPLYMQPMGTYMGFFMDGMIGKDYEKGLARLKAAAEAK